MNEICDVNTPDTSDSSAGLNQSETRKLRQRAQSLMQRDKKLRRDDEAHNLSQEEHKMTVIKLEIEEMEQKEKDVKTGP